jgi:RNA polymerase sigma-70 factor (ECF subfamily)
VSLSEPSALSDAELGGLMAAAQDGDGAAYDRLLRESVPVIRRIARYRGSPPASIDDIVQDVLLTIHRVRHTFDPARSFSAWLGAIAERRTIDFLRRHGRRAARELYAPASYENHPDEEGNPADMVEVASEARRLGVAIASLPDGQRQAVETVLSGRSLADAEALTGRSRTALKVNFHRAIKGLRARMTGGAAGS